MEVIHQWEYEAGDEVLISCNPGGFAFISEAQWHHWNEYNDGHYPVHGKIVRIDKREEIVVMQMNNESFSVHKFRLAYAQSHRCIFDPIML